MKVRRVGSDRLFTKTSVPSTPVLGALCLFFALAALLAGCYTPKALNTVTACEGGDQGACNNMSDTALESREHCVGGDAAACQDYFAARLETDEVACHQGNLQACADRDTTAAAIREGAQSSALGTASAPP